MKKTTLFLGMSLIIGLPMIANEKKDAQIITTVEQLTPEMWDKQCFASLVSEHKTEVIGILQLTQKCFQNTYDSVDKGADAFMESLELVVKIYTQIVMSFTPRAEMCLNILPIIRELEIKLPMIKALEILPSAKDVFEAATRFLSVQENMNEQDLKRAVKRVLRNKETKTEIKMILQKQCADIDGYITYIDAKYPQEVAKLAELKAQAQAQIEELVSKMQEQQG